MRTSSTVFSLSAALAVAASAHAQSFQLDFQGGVGSWNTVLDGVMGGLSTGRVTQPEPGLLRFTGELSLENNGGFSQMRRAVAEGALAGAEGLVMEVKGDGRTYNFDIRQSNVRMMAGSYQQSFETKDGQWTEVRLPLDEFTLYSFGRKVRRAPTLNPEKIESIGVTLSDKKAGPFALELRSIRAFGAGAEGSDRAQLEREWPRLLVRQRDADRFDLLRVERGRAADLAAEAVERELVERQAHLGPLAVLGLEALLIRARHHADVALSDVEVVGPTVALDLHDQPFGAGQRAFGHGATHLREAAVVLQRQLAGEAQQAWFGLRDAAGRQAAHDAVQHGVPRADAALEVELEGLGVGGRGHGERGGE